MATGLYRDKDDWVKVDYGGHVLPVQRVHYQAMGYQPPFDQLPTRTEYEARHG